MKLKNPMLVVTDIDKSVEFYKKVFGLHVRSRIPLKGKLPILQKERDRFSRFCPAPYVLTLFYKILIFPSTSSRI